MPKYLFEVSYTPAGIAGVLKDGGTRRRAAAQSLIEGLGGRLEAMYFAFGGTATRSRWSSCPTTLRQPPHRSQPAARVP